MTITAQSPIKQEPEAKCSRDLDGHEATPWFYPDKVSAAAGEVVRLHASARHSPCTLTLRRVGLETVTVANFSDIKTSSQPIPANADQNGCGWRETFRFTVASSWNSGYYDLELRDARGQSTHHFLCIKRAPQADKAPAVLILATNTWASYNYWGGSNSYAAVEDLMAGKLSADDSRDGAIGRLSRLRPYPQSLLVPPSDVPRLINMDHRSQGERPLPGRPDWNRSHRPSPYDGAAGFMHKWEHKFVAWAEAQGYNFDYLTDQDFVAGSQPEENPLADYKTVLVVGHSEYWSGLQRQSIERFVDDGGNLCIFSGNTCYWKVRWRMRARRSSRTSGVASRTIRFGQIRPRANTLRTFGRTPDFAAPEAALTGLSFLYGGYHRLCMCVSRGAAAYTIYDDEHWALADTDLYYGDQLGSGIPLIGYENDGCPIQFGEDGLPKSGQGRGIPDNLRVIALAPATLAEPARSPYPPLIPPEQTDVCAQVAYGSADEDTQSRLMRGHAVMASFERGEGEVFNAGTTEWAHGLAAGDAFVEKITHNVLQRFGLRPGITT